MTSYNHYKCNEFKANIHLYIKLQVILQTNFLFLLFFFAKKKLNFQLSKTK